MFLALSLPASMNRSPYWTREAVPRRTIRPPEVMGLEVPCLTPANAVLKFPLEAPVAALFVPGR